MDKGDIYTLIGGFVVILIVAIIANPGSLSGIPSLRFSGSTPAVQVTQTPAPAITVVTTEPTQAPEVNQTPRPPDQPYRIFYSSTPFAYPVVHLPEHMETFSSSDIPLRGGGPSIPFAYVEEPRGGLTQPFSVPYDVWVMNISVKAELQPQHAMFRMVLCDAKGNIITGSQIQYPGTMYKVARTSGKGFYMIISTSSIDSFRISLETPKESYEKQRQGA